MKVLVVNGPNLNLLGKREPEIYGEQTLEGLVNELKTEFTDVDLKSYQSNIEGELIDELHAADGNYHGVVLNAGGYTHTSVAIRDAINGIEVPVIEVHMSNIANREEFRHNSLISAVCIGSIAGFGKHSYALAIHALRRHFQKAR